MSDLTQDQLEQLLAAIDYTAECWTYSGDLLGTNPQESAYVLLKAPVPVEHRIEATCGNPMCIRPLHLEPTAEPEPTGHPITDYVHTAHCPGCAPVAARLFEERAR